MRQASGKDEMEVPDDRTPLVGASKAGRALSGYGGVLALNESGRSTNQHGDSLIDIDYDGERRRFFLIAISVGRKLIQ
jgi:hypothetical protein